MTASVMTASSALPALHLLRFSAAGQRGGFGSLVLGPPLWIAGRKRQPAKNLDRVGGLLADVRGGGLCRRNLLTVLQIEG